MRTISISSILIMLIFHSGCMYHIEHRIPMHASFGSSNLQEAQRTPFEFKKTKRYLLGGVIPWSSLPFVGEKKLDTRPGRKIEKLQISTKFGPVDLLLKLVPYASYLLAQRSVEIRGVYVDVPLTAQQEPELR